MTTPFKAIEITDDIYWVGAIDWNLRRFHGYDINRGTTYNAFLIKDKKNVLIDMVRAPFKDELFSRIRSVIEPEKIDLIVSNHAEMDHSGALPDTIDLIQPEKVLASAKGVEALKAHYNIDQPLEAVKDGSEIDIGRSKLKFIETKMLHWPDSMVTFVPDKGVLFSQDAFGLHLATSERFDDELPESILEYEAAHYYANILLPYSKLIPKLAEKLSELDIKIFATDHGPVWRSRLEWIVDLYKKWAAQKPTMKAVIVYDTMWESTALMSRALADGLREGSASVKLMSLAAHTRSDIATELLDAGAILIGSPTINGEMYPTLGEILTYMKGLKFQHLIGDAFGSYGWVPNKTVREIRDKLSEMKIELVSENGVSCHYVPTDDILMHCRELGIATAKMLKEKSK